MALDTKFDPKELEISRTVPFAFGDPIKLFTTPITFKENMMRLYEGKTPMWTPFAFGETTMYMVSVDPENQARSPEGGIDGYGVEWTFVPSAGGAMVKPGDPKILDINHWEDYVTIPTPTPGTGRRPRPSWTPSAPMTWPPSSPSPAASSSV